jgi:hypothetical protein
MQAHVNIKDRKTRQAIWRAEGELPYSRRFEDISLFIEGAAENTNAAVSSVVSSVSQAIEVVDVIEGALGHEVTPRHIRVVLSGDSILTVEVPLARSVEDDREDGDRS